MKRILMTLSLLAMSFGASAMVIYQNDFEGGDTNGWSGGQISNGVYVQSKGFFGFRDIGFQNENPAYIGGVNLMFDVITYGDWDQPNDQFEATARIWGLFNDQTIFEATLNDGVNSLMISGVPLYGGIDGFLGGNTDLLSLKFESNGTNSREYFGIDNFKVIGAGAAGLPEPGTLAIFLIGLAGIAASRRRAR